MAYAVGNLEAALNISHLMLTPPCREVIFPILGVTIHIFGFVGDKHLTFLKIFGKKFTRGLGAYKHFKGNSYSGKFYCEFSVK